MTHPPGSILPFVKVAQGTPDVRRILAVRTDRVRSASSGRELDVDRVITADWVNVVALVPGEDEDALLLVRQWRFGRETFTLEVPAGLVESGEEPEAAALRELREETGCAPAPGSAVVYLGRTLPNPAFMTNALHTYWVPRALRVQAPSPDPHEELEVVLLPISQLEHRIREGQLESALVLAALYRWRLHASPR